MFIKRLVLVASIVFNHSVMFSQQVYPLYSGEIPNSKPHADEESSEIKNGILIISKVSRPTLTVYLPAKEKATGSAVIICPGGGYWILAAGHEGADVAKQFVELGVAAIVLKYRLPDEATMLDKTIGPLQDAQQAIKTTRDSAAAWNIDPKRIGIIGFSAGGHLAATAGTHFNKALITNKSNSSLRPDFMLLIYPVISFQPAIRHNGSMENLIGKDASQAMMDAYSGELQVTNQTPPTFLVHASDDGGVSAMNSIVFYEALLRHHVSAELHLYQSGGHGFGLTIPNSKELWMERCRNWMQLNGWLTRK